MKFFSRFRRKSREASGANVTDLAKSIGPLLDDLANAIFFTYRDILISEPITYIVPAVWGAAKDSALSEEQKEINERVLPVMKRVFDILQVDELTEAQAFAIGFIVRGLVISKITYMIEALKNKLIAVDVHKRDFLIKNIEPIGHA